ncbi:MAG: nitroreductase family protein [candidate division WOR-3 bacterium]|nr:MAG: nitroreductase family protein [candidate division WOR-3 bacterium]
MDVLKAIQWRRSVRKFSQQKIEYEKILQLLEAARLAPSSSNQQAWHFVVIDDKAIIEEIPKQVLIGTRSIISFVKDAPLVIAGCYAKKLSHVAARLFGHENDIIDIAIAMTHIVLAATELGIGTCYIGWFNVKKLKNLLHIPREYNIALLLALGYPIDASTDEGIGGIAPRSRKELEKIVSHNKFGQRF